MRLPGYGKGLDRYEVDRKGHVCDCPGQGRQDQTGMKHGIIEKNQQGSLYTVHTYLYRQQDNMFS
jgi:hypothetical protein